MMRLFFLLLVSAALPAWAGEHPAANALDYEAHYVDEPEDDGISPSGRVVIHHAGLIRTQSQQIDGTRSDFSKLGTAAFVTLITGSDGMPRALYFRGAFDREREVERIERSDESALLAGEACKWWTVNSRRIDIGGSGLTSSECYATDGVLLGRRFGPYGQDNTYSMTVAREIRRGPVRLGEVLPAPALLDPAAWIDPRGPDQAEKQQYPDYTLIYHHEGRTIERKRHYPWVIEKVSDTSGLVRVKAWNEVDHGGWSFQMGTDNQPGRFSISRRVPGDRDQHLLASGYDVVTTPKKTKKRETISGEACTWYNMAPGVHDIGQHQCLTSDMVPVAIEHYGEISGITRWTASKVSRAPVAFDEMRPRKEWFELAFWGLGN